MAQLEPAEPDTDIIDEFTTADDICRMN